MAHEEDDSVRSTRVRTETIAALVSPSFKKELEDLAKAKDISMAKMIRKALTEYKQKETTS